MLHLQQAVRQTVAKRVGRFYATHRDGIDGQVTHYGLAILPLQQAKATTQNQV